MSYTTFGRSRIGLRVVENWANKQEKKPVDNAYGIFTHLLQQPIVRSLGASNCAG